MEKQKLLYQQARLHDRGAAEMVLQTLSASKGDSGPMVAATLKLGIAVLNGGNSTVQQKMLDYLKEKKDVGFFQSLAGLMQSCSVLDLNAFERHNKAEGLGMVTEEGSGEAPMLVHAADSFSHPCSFRPSTLAPHGSRVLAVPVPLQTYRVLMLCGRRPWSLRTDAARPE
ncbi:Ryanodine receptor 2 [Tupaia chinensis]|uniref:Ryanodine receptor 2 n=1 Tax=Tupaia chinensis TaxID=246437 RepID=L9KZ88_TUPCH|nr:Ryanodine receptor 2 [Tupaia chinensis]